MMKQKTKKILRNTYNHLAASFGPHRWPASEPRLWVLMYHRILPEMEAKAQKEEPGMFVTPATFESHMLWLKEFFKPISLEEWVMTDAEDLPARSIAITFDDGWKDNYDYAFPILKKQKIPATIFLVSHMVDTYQTFWPNRLVGMLDILQGTPEWPASCHWLQELIGDSQSGFPDEEVKSNIITKCKTLGDREIIKRLDLMEEELGQREGAHRVLLNWEEIRNMKMSGLVDFGSHTCHHYRLLSSLEDDIIRSEITHSKEYIDSHLNQQTKLFCYPNGNTSKVAIDEVEKHYLAAVTTQRGINKKEQSAMELLRIGMHEDISSNRSAFLSRLANLR